MVGDFNSEEGAQYIAIVDPEGYERLYRKKLYRLMGKISLYYLFLTAFFTGLFFLVPSLFEYLPLGGLGDLAREQSMFNTAIENAARDLDLDTMEEIARSVGAVKDNDAWWVDALNILTAMSGTLLLMLPVTWTYRNIHRGHEFDHSIDETALLLPSIVTGIVAIVQYSLALAFSLAGIVAGVRFRRALNDTFDTLFIFVAIAVGLAAGVGSIEIAVVVTFFFNYVTLIMCISGDGLQSTHDARKKAEKKSRKRMQEL